MLLKVELTFPKAFVFIQALSCFSPDLLNIHLHIFVLESLLKEAQRSVPNG